MLIPWLVVVWCVTFGEREIYTLSFFGRLDLLRYHVVSTDFDEIRIVVENNQA